MKKSSKASNEPKSADPALVADQIITDANGETRGLKPGTRYALIELPADAEDVVISQPSSGAKVGDEKVRWAGNVVWRTPKG